MAAAAKLKALGVAALGLVSGGAGAVIIGGGNSRSPTVSGSRSWSEPPSTHAVVEDGRFDRARLAALEAQVAEMSAQASTSPAQSVVPIQAAHPQRDQLDPIAQASKDQADHEAFIVAHYKEEVDHAWAPDTRKVILRGLEQMSSHLTAKDKSWGFRVLETGCRTSPCVAVLEWPTYATALTRAHDLVYDTLNPCGIEIVLTAPSDPNAPYRNTVYYPCAVARWGPQD